LARRIERAYPEDRDRLEASLSATRLGGGSAWNEEYRLRRADGRYATVVEKGFMLRDAEGVPYRMVGSLVDVTEERTGQEKLARAQRMEAVGRLAGSVAHDFNNILSAIGSFAELIGESPSDADVRESTEEILRATRRGSELTRQLLTFGRRQRVRPRLVNADQVIAETRPMLERLIGRSIRLEIASKPPVASVMIDPGQLEQVIVNLIVNARDAMPHGGQIRVSTVIVELLGAAAEAIPDARPGRYTKIRVEDTGIGMSEEVMAQMFEPFFTTKESESGTGLGLATVLGIVQQNGGFVRAHSRMGSGTYVDVCLPACEGDEDGQLGSATGDIEAEAVGSREGSL
jgi:signal transduction histidine kinase